MSNVLGGVLIVSYGGALRVFVNMFEYGMPGDGVNHEITEHETKQRKRYVST